MTDRYAVIGNPIAQSKSPRIHAAFARQTGQDLSYEPLLATPQTFADTVLAFRQAGGKGMNVTAPFKLQAARLADRLTERAQAARAVNTLVFSGQEILGDNTDGVGLVRDITERLGFRLQGQRVLLIGAGGAARGILLPLVLAAPHSLLVVNRSPQRAHDLVASLKDPAPILESGAFEAAASCEFDLVLHASSAGLNDGQAPALDYRLAPGASLAYDLAYAPAPTPFMLQAQQRGAGRVSDGLGMLVGQAAESFHLWRGVRPDVAPVLWELTQVP